MSLRYPSTLLIFFAVLWVKAIYPPSSGIADTDFYWHLTYGRWIADHHAIPAADFFSWTFAGQPYQLTQWLGEAIMGVAYNFAGLDGTKILSVLLSAVTIGFAWLAAKRYVHTSLALGLALTCNLVQIVSPMRPQLFSFTLLAIATYLIVSYMETGRLRFIAVYPVLMVAWVNLHGGFVIGLLIFGLMAAGLTAEAYLSGNLRSSARVLARTWVALIMASLATLINPYGITAIPNVLMISSLQSSSVISEWMPVNLTTAVGWFYLLNLVPFIALLAVSGSRPRLTQGLIAGVFLIFGILANRQVAMCAAVMAPITAALLARTPQYGKMLPTITNPNRPILFTLITVLLVGAFPAIAAKGNGTWERTMNLKYPVYATDFLVQHDLTKRVMSDTLEASYLIHRGVPVFIDGRMDLYKDKFFFEWYLASRAAPSWEAVIEKHQPAVLLLRLDMAIRQAALATGKWRQIYEDERYSILVPTDNWLPTVKPRKINYLDSQGRMSRPYMP